MLCGGCLRFFSLMRKGSESVMKSNLTKSSLGLGLCAKIPNSNSRSLLPESILLRERFGIPADLFVIRDLWVFEAEVYSSHYNSKAQHILQNLSICGRFGNFWAGVGVQDLDPNDKRFERERE
eukprot:317320-Amphidinium_carterae.1